MQRRDRWLGAAFALASISLCAGSLEAAAARKDAPAHVERIEGTALSRVTLTARAMGRLGIETGPVREGAVARTRTVAGEVMEPGRLALEGRPPPEGRLELAVAPGAGAVPPGGGHASPDGGPPPGDAPPGAALVRVGPLGDEAGEVVPGRPALVRPLSGGGAVRGWAARLVGPSALAALEGAEGALYYEVGGEDHGLKPGQRVRVELPISEEAPRKVVPAGAVIHDPQGEAWVYTNPEPLVFVRHRVEVDYFDGDRAVLKDGPAAGTMVVTVGAPLVLGTEFEIGH
jgi:hypothetical protein